MSSKPNLPKPPISSAAIVVAGGRGERLGGAKPKQFHTLAGHPLLAWSVKALASHPAIGPVIVVVPETHKADAQTALAGLSTVSLVGGGETRQASVRAGLNALADHPHAPDHVMIHDAARPLLSHALIDRLLAGLETHDAVIPAVAVRETIKRVGADRRVHETVPRDGLWLVQTPQAFSRDVLTSLHQRFAEASFTDDAALFEAAGRAVEIAEGDPANLKLTYPEDWPMAERLLAPRADGPRPAITDVRTGHGYDVHRLGPGDGVWLGGLKLPSDRSLIGHSDADVLLHVVVDALLGAIGEGDIGQHFPPSDPQWQGVASSRFVDHARDLASAAGWTLRNADLLVIAEHPKVTPHRGAIRAKVASLLQIDESRVNVKATTTERLGFTGRGEGIAAQAVITVTR
ncbi:MAG: bifunctional 2-C-methyl-D-erythritol 4-phosphate cytidylyltransferase/2-C-methyl-D-erythritol 2,4-cyclodiphosphate synthase [Pseudomonadota bacterium]